MSLYVISAAKRSFSELEDDDEELFPSKKVWLDSIVWKYVFWMIWNSSVCWHVLCAVYYFQMYGTTLTGGVDHATTTIINLRARHDNSLCVNWKNIFYEMYSLECIRGWFYLERPFLILSAHIADMLFYFCSLEERDEKVASLQVRVLFLLLYYRSYVSKFDVFKEEQFSWNGKSLLAAPSYVGFLILVVVCVLKYMI